MALEGHWRGSIEIPDQPLALEVDLDKMTNDWIGFDRFCCIRCRIRIPISLL